MNRPRPVVVPPVYNVRNQFVRRVFPVIHPVVEVNRINVFDVPRHIIRPIRRREVVYHQRRRFY